MKTFASLSNSPVKSDGEILASVASDEFQLRLLENKASSAASYSLVESSCGYTVIPLCGEASINEITVLPGQFYSTMLPPRSTMSLLSTGGDSSLLLIVAPMPVEAALSLQTAGRPEPLTDEAVRTMVLLDLEVDESASSKMRMNWIIEKFLAVIAMKTTSGKSTATLPVEAIVLYRQLRGLGTGAAGLFERIDGFLSPYRRDRLALQLYGKTFKQLQREKRLHTALQRILHTQVPVSAIADQTGYKTAAVFVNRFKRYYGVTPLQARIAFRLP